MASLCSLSEAQAIVEQLDVDSLPMHTMNGASSFGVRPESIYLIARAC